MTRNKLKEAALRLFGQKGYDGTALSEIAKAVGVKTPAIYAFFESKEDLFLTVFEESMQAYNEYVKAWADTMTGASMEERLRALLLRQYDFHREQSELGLFTFRYMMFPPAFLAERIQEAFVRSDELLTDMVSGIMQGGLDSGQLSPLELEELVDSYLALMDGLGAQFYYYKSEELFERKMDHAFQTFWRAVKA